MEFHSVQNGCRFLTSQQDGNYIRQQWYLPNSSFTSTTPEKGLFSHMATVVQQQLRPK
jgi:hypothetical protein